MTTTRISMPPKKPSYSKSKICKCSKNKKKKKSKSKSKTKKKTKSKQKKNAKKKNFSKQLMFGGGGSGKNYSGLKKTQPSAASAAFARDIPLFKVIKDLKPEKRAIILASLNNNSCSALIKCIKKVLQNKKFKSGARARIKKLLLPQKQILRQLITSKKIKQKKELLPQVGGSLGFILAAAIPLLLDLARAKKWI